MPSREYYLKEDESHYKDAYLKYMTNIAILLGSKDEVAKRDMAEVLQFEIRLAEVSLFYFNYYLRK